MDGKLKRDFFDKSKDIYQFLDQTSTHPLHDKKRNTLKSSFNA